MISYVKPDIAPYESFLTALIRQFKLFLWIARFTGDTKEFYLLPSFRLYRKSKGCPYLEYHLIRCRLFEGMGVILCCEFNHDYLFEYQSFYDQNNWEWIKDMANLCYETSQDTSWMYPDCTAEDIPF